MTKQDKQTQQHEQPQRRALELPRCAWEKCQAEFIPSGPKQKYCRPAHKVAAYNERQKQQAEK